ncbi:MAG: STAS domain-containing protein [Candidatus Tumulicola sp.]
MESIVIEYRPDAYPVVEAALLAALAEAESTIVLDLDSLDSLDTDGVRGLIMLLRRARASGRDLSLSATKPSILRTLQVTALDRLFGMVAAEPA